MKSKQNDRLTVCDRIHSELGFSELNKFPFTSLYQFNIEEMNLEKNQFVTTLQKRVKKETIDSALQQIIKAHSYQRGKIQIRCLDAQFILKIILYLIIREGKNIVQITKLQFEIKKRFAELPGLKKVEFDPKILQRSFLFEIILISRIAHQIMQQLKLPSLHQTDPETIFIVIIFLSTDKLVSPNCFRLIHQKLKTKQLPFGKHSKKQLAQSFQGQKERSEITEAESFKQEVRSIIFPKSQQKQLMENVQPVGLMINMFKNKENMSHYLMNKALRESSHEKIVDLCRFRKCFSQQSSNFMEKSQGLTEDHQIKYNWSKCELVKNNYIPFCSIKAPAAQKGKVISNSYLKFKKLKQKTVHFQLKIPHLLLKI